MIVATTTTCASSFAHASACSNQALFAPPVNRVTGPGPLWMVTGDFNGDGRLDIAISNSDFQESGSPNASVAILLGAGGGNFNSPVVYQLAGDEPHGIALGDFNQDGITDLAVACKGSGTVAILLGQGTSGVGDGTFAPPVHYPAGGYPFQIVASDFNGDGITDLAVCLNSFAAVSVLRGVGSGGVGNGSFAAPVQFSISTVSTGIEKGDFNHDGITDLVVTENSAHTVGVLIGTGAPTIGAGSFQPVAHYQAGSAPFDVAVGDFNGDGADDIAVANSPGGTAVLLGLGNGAFNSPTIFNTGNSIGVAVGDLDHDGILDLAVTTATGTDGGNVHVFIGLGTNGVGNGSFGSESIYSVGADTYQATIVDYNADGRMDLLVSDYLHNYISVLTGTCTTDNRAPKITKVRDVPNDQGGHVFVTWTASSLDATGGSVINYRVWRRIPPAMAAPLARARRIPSTWMRTRAAGTNDIVYWEALTTLPAQRLAGYGFTAPTTQDSLPNSNPYTAFFVSALTTDIDVFYSSDVDSGYSVDNLAPPAPSPFVAIMDGAQADLHWTASPVPDFRSFRLYRGPSGFTASPGTLIAESPDTGYVDNDPSASLSDYRLSVVDIHGNEGPPSVAVPQSTVAVDDVAPIELALRGTIPNPSRDGRLRVSFALPNAHRASLELLDVAGRLVAALEVGSLGAGRHTVDLANRTRPRAGIYFLRLVQDARQLRSRVVVLN
ncbi:MAG: T9SS type A sorting domain-containing protein [Candidatus Eisenbacteria bacterium]|uniref:T9SS type A sorting domain-containing protein n=1 Tax=Eiseniibacteriota bacterium TaxID=2212470 RepID=A0A9D6L5Q2_UNCEI|nr:T9SS type A sorting domain-containing protein [Candidatus Eisenbacteria bacterium]MBI3539276.1 T9SS type A sorting domain-containing protein [Candidatus Eisenbacteria bacterium]